MVQVKRIKRKGQHDASNNEKYSCDMIDVQGREAKQRGIRSMIFFAESSIAEKNAGTGTKQRHAERTQGKTRKEKK